MTKEINKIIGLMVIIGIGVLIVIGSSLTLRAMEQSEQTPITIEMRERLIDISNNKPIPAKDWRTTVKEIDKQIKANKGIKVDNYNSELKTIVNKLLK